MSSVIQSLKERLKKLKLAPDSPSENANEECLASLRLVLFRLRELESVVFGGDYDQCNAFDSVPQGKRVVRVDNRPVLDGSLGSMIRPCNMLPDINEALDLAKCEVSNCLGDDVGDYYEVVSESCSEECREKNH